MKKPIERLKPKSLSETIGEELVRMIAVGQLEPGQRLNEVHLAEAFGVSRGPVREAARELEGQGLLTSRPRQGFYVADFTAAEIVDLYEVKLWIDQAIVNDVLAYAKPETCRAVLADVDNIDRTEKVAFAATLFHYRQRMVAQLHNRVLATQALALYRQFYLVTSLITVDEDDSTARMDRIVRTLQQFWSALADGDGATACQIMKEDAEFWSRDVAPRFAKIVEIEKK